MKYLNISKLLNSILRTGPVNYYSYRPASGLMNRGQVLTPMTILENKVEKQDANLENKFTLHAEDQIADKRLGILASALVHEVRNPLNNINLAAEFIDSGKLDEEQKAFVEIINRGVDRIRNLVNDFLISHKSIETHAEICSLNELVDDVLALNQDRLRLNDVFIIKNYSYKDWKIRVKKREIIVAITNILINAIEAMPAGYGKLKITTGATNDQCFLKIEDNGTGISAENLRKIFNPFFTNKPGGIGLGLSTAKEMVLSNGGAIEVKSEPESGTRFDIGFNKV
jgi:signal transduction histidine kinase